MQKKVSSVAFVLLIFIGSARTLASEISGNVVRILNGDTVEILVDRQPIKVRLAAIDAPEKSQAFGTASKQSLSSLIFRHAVTVEIHGVDRYGRTIGTIYDGKVNVNSEQVRRGMAWVYRRYTNDNSLIALELTARAQRVGLWSDAEPVKPWKYRRTR